MITASMQSSHSSSDQAAQVIAFASPREHLPVLRHFDDNLDHLQALEYEAKLMVAVATLRRGLSDSRDTAEERFPFLPQGAGLLQAQEMLRSASEENRQREELSQKAGQRLNFQEFCDQWNLDPVERLIVLLLFMQQGSPEFQAVFEKSQLEQNYDSGMEIGVLLAIISSDSRGQMENRRYFSINSKLLSTDIISSNSRHIDHTTSITRMSVYLHERNARYLLGDNNQYHLAFKFIKQSRSSVKLDNVVLPEQKKSDIVRSVEQYLQKRASGVFENLDQHFGYGTGLALMFYGPSGTGKSMLAAALANHLNCPLISMDFGEANEIPMDVSDILSVLFREAALLGGMVLLDECDDLFDPDNRRLNRALLLELERSRCITILATNRPVELDPAMERRIAVKQRFELPDAEQRLQIWQRLIPPGVELAPDVDLPLLSRRLPLSGGLIKNCILLALTASRSPINEAPQQLQMADLEAAIVQQQHSYNDEDGLRKIYRPEITLSQLALPEEQQRLLAGIADAWLGLQGNNTGFSLLINSCDIEAGARAAEGLAAACNCEVHQYDYSRLIRETSREDRILVPATQKRVLPIDYAFQVSSDPEVMFLALDHDGFLKELLEENDNERVGEFLNSRLLMRLRKHGGLFCIVSDIGNSRRRAPVEFNLKLDLGLPPLDMQRQQWQRHLEQGYDPAALQRMVQQYPLHLTEIDYLARQAGIMAAISGRFGRPGLKEAQNVLSSYRPTTRSVMLFGGEGRQM